MWTWHYPPELFINQDNLKENPEHVHLGLQKKYHFDDLGLGTLPISQVDPENFTFWSYQYPAVIVDWLSIEKELQHGHFLL